jgi:hypothetical protein
MKRIDPSETLDGSHFRIGEPHRAVDGFRELNLLEKALDEETEPMVERKIQIEEAASAYEPATGLSILRNTVRTKPTQL